MAVTTFYPDPHTESTSVDGHVNSTGMTWNTPHDATSGTAVSHDATTLKIEASIDDFGFGTIKRGFFLFDTSAIDDSDTIDSADFKLYVTAKINGDNDGQDYMSVVTSSPASNTNLVTGDFDQCGSIDDPTKQSDDIDIGSISTSAYNTWTVNATGLGNIDAAGITKFGMREGHDQEDNSPAFESENSITVSSAEETGTSQDPALVVTHSAAAATFTPTLIIVS